MKVITIIQHKIYIADIYIFYIVICKLCYWQKLGLIILLEIDKKLEIIIYYAVLPFDLAISLRIKNSKELLFDTKEVAE